MFDKTIKSEKLMLKVGDGSDFYSDSTFACADGMGSAYTLYPDGPTREIFLSNKYLLSAVKQNMDDEVENEEEEGDEEDEEEIEEKSETKPQSVTIAGGLITINPKTELIHRRQEVLHLGPEREIRETRYPSPSNLEYLESLRRERKDFSPLSRFFRKYGVHIFFLICFLFFINFFLPQIQQWFEENTTALGPNQIANIASILTLLIPVVIIMQALTCMVKRF